MRKNGSLICLDCLVDPAIVLISDSINLIVAANMPLGTLGLKLHFTVHSVEGWVAAKPLSGSSG